MKHISFLLSILMALATPAMAQAPNLSLNPLDLFSGLIAQPDVSEGYYGANWQTPGYSATVNNSGSKGMKPIGYTSSGVAYTSDYNLLKKEITNPVQASNYIKENLDYIFISGTAGMDPSQSNKDHVTDCKTAARMITDLVSDDGWTGTIWGYEYADQPKNGHTIAVMEKSGVGMYLESTYDIYSIGSMSDAWAIEKDRIGGTHTIGATKSFPAGYGGPTAAW